MQIPPSPLCDLAVRSDPYLELSLSEKVCLNPIPYEVGWGWGEHLLCTPLYHQILQEGSNKWVLQSENSIYVLTKDSGKNCEIFGGESFWPSVPPIPSIGMGMVSVSVWYRYRYGIGFQYRYGFQYLYWYESLSSISIGIGMSSSIGMVPIPIPKPGISFVKIPGINIGTIPIPVSVSVWMSGIGISMMVSVWWYRWNTSDQKFQKQPRLLKCNFPRKNHVTFNHWSNF